MNEKRPLTIKEKLANLPTKPGVYLFKDKFGEILYIGKAKILRNRVRSYFQAGRAPEPKLKRLVARIADLETIVTDSEVEALILEANLVKENKPRYNINLKDDKSFPFIRVTNEPYPRIFPTRKIIQDGSRYYGPYTDVQTMRTLLKTVSKIFAVRSCNYHLTDEQIRANKFKICLDYHIKRCYGPCEGLIDQAEYNKIIDNVVDFIQGHTQKVEKDLTVRIHKLSSELKFEQAARLRDQLQSIEMFQQRQKMVDGSHIDRDIIAVAQEANDACCVVFKVRDGKMIGRQHFYIKGVRDEAVNSVITSFIKQYYLQSDYVPKEVYIQEDPEDRETLLNWLTEKRGSSVRMILPQRGDKAHLLKMSIRNAKLLLDELLLQKKQKKELIAGSVVALQDTLKLTVPPKRIEGFDISNIQGTNPVASMVCFINGVAAKSEYRRFKIRSKETPDDFLMMHEAVFRRYSRILNEKKSMPDLILIDGGKGQLNAALKALKTLGLTEQPIISLAKRLDEIYIPGNPDPQNINHVSPAIKLLQRVRDESHRFAVTYHRKLRKKRTLISVLDEIPGIGPERRKILLETLGSLQKVKKASVRELMQVNGISESLAKDIREFFHPEEKGITVSENNNT